MAQIRDRPHDLTDDTIWFVRFEFLTAASMKMAVFWVVAPCSLVDGTMIMMMVCVCLYVCLDVWFYFVPCSLAFLFSLDHSAFQEVFTFL
jgi:hypothetical protein